MSKVSTLKRHAREIMIAMLLIAFVALTAGCGKNTSSAFTPPPGGDSPPVPPPAPVEGIATPTSVAVVTATNAQ